MWACFFRAVVVLVIVPLLIGAGYIVGYERGKLSAHHEQVKRNR